MTGNDTHCTLIECTSVPTTPFDQATALPVQVYLWQGNELRNFFEGRTAAAIIVLLALMIGLNSLAIWLRKSLKCVGNRG